MRKMSKKIYQRYYYREQQTNKLRRAITENLIKKGSVDVANLLENTLKGTRKGGGALNKKTLSKRSYEQLKAVAKKSFKEQQRFILRKATYNLKDIRKESKGVNQLIKKVQKGVKDLSKKIVLFNNLSSGNTFYVDKNDDINNIYQNSSLSQSEKSTAIEQLYQEHKEAYPYASGEIDSILAMDYL